MSSHAADIRAPDPAIEVRDLRRSYGKTEAVRGVSLDVARGEVFCLLGPNGAGKTTIVEILGIPLPLGGWARVLGIIPPPVLGSCASWSRCTAAITCTSDRSTRSSSSSS